MKVKWKLLQGNPQRVLSYKQLPRICGVLAAVCQGRWGWNLKTRLETKAHKEEGKKLIRVLLARGMEDDQLAQLLLCTIAKSYSSLSAPLALCQDTDPGNQACEVRRGNETSNGVSSS